MDMEAIVIMRDAQTEQKRKVFSPTTPANAFAISQEMNRLNSEAARITGKAIRFFYSFALTSKDWKMNLSTIIFFCIIFAIFYKLPDICDTIREATKEDGEE